MIYFVLLTFGVFLWLSKTYTLSGYYLSDLTGISLLDFHGQASSWTASNQRTSVLYPSTCLVYMMGGPGILGTTSTALNDYFQQKYTGLLAHNMIYYSLSFYALSSWDAYDRFQLIFDSRKVNGWMIPNSNHLLNICGSSDYGPLVIFGRIAHSNDSLTLKVWSLLDQNSGDESFGFRDIYMLFATTREPISEEICGKAASPNPVLYTNRCPCASGKYEANSVGSGVCLDCHYNCNECFGASERECYSCRSGYTFNGYACVLSCHPTCGGSISNCFGSDATNCLVCLTGYYLTDINSCLTSAQCSYPLVKSVSGGVNVCLSPCTSDEYAYKNGSCLTTCPYPLQSSKTANFNFCNGCGGSQFLYYDGSCKADCTYPWRTRIEGGIRFCDYPCENTEILYWDQICRSECPFPLELHYEVTLKFCRFPCLSNKYLYPTKSCESSCPFPLNSSVLGGANFCNNLCDDSQFLYWNGSCMSECKSPFRYQGDDVADYCLPPCANPLEYFNLDTEVCESTCDGIVWSDSFGMYRTCKLIEENGISYLEATDIGKVSILALVKPLDYIRYLNIAVPQRLKELMSGKQRNIFSLRFGYEMSPKIRAQFTKYEIPEMFERAGLHSSFVVNYWTEITSFVILLMILIGSLFFEKLFAFLSYTMLHAFFERIRAVMKWNVFLILIATGVGEIVLFTRLEFMTFHFFTFSSNLSLLVCLFMLAMLVAFVINILHLVSGFQDVKSQALVSRPHDDYANFLVKWQGYQLVFRGFKENYTHQKYFYILYCLRVATPMLIACFIYQIPFLQTTLYLSISIITVMYLFMKKPLKNKTNWIQLLVIENITLIINSSLFVLTALDIGKASTGAAGVFFGDVVIVGNCCLTLTLIIFLIIKVVNLAKIAETLYKKQPELGRASVAQIFFAPLQQCGFGFEYVQVCRFLYEIKPQAEESDLDTAEYKTAMKRFKFSKEKTSLEKNTSKSNWMFEMFAATRSRTKDKDGENYFDEIEDELEIFGRIKNPS